MEKRTITLECLIRSREVVDLLEDYNNSYLYYLNGKQLDLASSLKVYQHSPTGFRHGYAGSGPAQLALAICLELYSEPVAKAVYKRFKHEFISALPVNEEFKIELSVPIDPLKYWYISKEAVEWQEPVEKEKISQEEQVLEETLKKDKEAWQQKLDQAYEKTVRLKGDQRFDFSTESRRGKSSFCFIRIFDPLAGESKITVVATDPGEGIDAGMSITNAAEMVAKQVCEEFCIPLEKLRWIERYVDKPSLQGYKSGRLSIQDRWDEVQFKIQSGSNGEAIFSNPDWQPLIEEMIQHFRDRCR